MYSVILFMQKIEMHFYVFFWYVIYKMNILKNFYCYSITVVFIFSPSLHLTPAEPKPNQTKPNHA